MEALSEENHFLLLFVLLLLFSVFVCQHLLQGVVCPLAVTAPNVLDLVHPEECVTLRCSHILLFTFCRRVFIHSFIHSLSLSVCLSVCVSVCLCVSVSVYFSPLSFPTSLSLSLPLSSPPPPPRIFLFWRRAFIHSLIYSFIHSFVLSVCLSVCLFRARALSLSPPPPLVPSLSSSHLSHSPSLPPFLSPCLCLFHPPPALSLSIPLSNLPPSLLPPLPPFSLSVHLPCSQTFTLIIMLLVVNGIGIIVTGI